MEQQAARPLAVVTGASSGIGLELAKQFAGHGFDLLISSSGDRLKDAARELLQGGARVQEVQTDLATYEGVEALWEAIEATGRPVEAIAINAGVGVGGDFTRQTDLKDELNLIQLNITSLVHLAKRVLPQMVARGRGRVLVTSSIIALSPGAFQAVYAASKAFVQSFTLALRNELKDTGVTITALQPGATETDFFHRAAMDDTAVGAAEKDDPALVAQQGFAALMANEDTVIAGSLKTRVQGNLSKVMPDSVTVEQSRKMAEPASLKEQGRR